MIRKPRYPQEYLDLQVIAWKYASIGFLVQHLNPAVSMEDRERETFGLGALIADLSVEMEQRLLNAFPSVRASKGRSSNRRRT